MVRLLGVRRKDCIFTKGIAHRLRRSANAWNG